MQDVVRVPPLNALRTFEAAARLESFTLAAAELGVTQSAVSKQVAQIENHLGRILFRRFHRRVELTHEGRVAARAVASSLATLRSGLAELRESRPERIDLVADADFVRCWLFPRLTDFEAQHPGIRISIRAETTLERLPDDGYDCGIFWGRGDWSNCRFEPIFANAVFPVAAPGFFASLGRSPRLSDLRDRLLIHDRSPRWWKTILASRGVTDVDPDFGRVYNQTALCLDAAARGDGVTVGDEVTTRVYLETGQLAIPFAIRIPSPDAYFFLLPVKAGNRQAVELFRTWLREQAAEHSRWFVQYWRDKQ